MTTVDEVARRLGERVDEGDAELMRARKAFPARGRSQPVELAPGWREFAEPGTGSRVRS